MAFVYQGLTSAQQVSLTKHQPMEKSSHREDSRGGFRRLLSGLFSLGWPSLRTPALELAGSGVAALRLSCPSHAGSLSTDQGLNPRPLCCKADSTTGTPGNSLHSSLFSVLRPHLLCFPCWEKQLVMMKCHEIKRYGGEENKYKHSRLVNT